MQTDQIARLIADARRILILQADNPDGDSLGSALALEQILHDLGKEPLLYCAIDMPQYLRYLPGWDRVQKDIPAEFDLSIIVDASTMTLFERLEQSADYGRVAARPCLVLDHHEEVSADIPFASVLVNLPERASTGELIYLIAQELNWPLSVAAQEYMLTSILGDTQGLTNNLASPLTYRIVADMIDGGVDRPKIEELRRASSKMAEPILRYKGELIRRSELHHDGRIAIVSIPQAEINQYSPLYNPAPLVQGDLLMTERVACAIVLKQYDNGRITGAIRCNPGYPIAAALAERFGGGGHAYASGFKIINAASVDTTKTACLTAAAELLNALPEDTAHEPVRYQVA